jgi:YegS/Rv2252/BmrU family lipid kinase
MDEGGMAINENWLVVINPNAGSRKGEKDWPKIAELLDEYGFKYKTVFTENRNHAIDLTASALNEGFRKIIAVGGDGTMNEVVNGIFRQKACSSNEVIIGMIPVGTGNDWGRTYEMPKKYRKAIKVIMKDYRFTQDVGHVSYYDQDEKQERYFVNVSGMGYDALVALKTNRMKDKGKGGTMAYMMNIFTGLFQYKNTHFDIDVDGKHVFSGKVLSMNLGICKYNGGGLMQVPNAIPDDGLLDVTIIKGISKFAIVRNIAKLYDGSFIKLKFVDTFRGSNCRIVSRPKGVALLEADGESLGHSPLDFSVLPKTLNLIIPEPKQKD